VRASPGHKAAAAAAAAHSKIAAFREHAIKGHPSLIRRRITQNHHTDADIIE
jgi:hypothetical protein